MKYSEGKERKFQKGENGQFNQKAQITTIVKEC